MPLQKYYPLVILSAFRKNVRVTRALEEWDRLLSKAFLAHLSPEQFRCILRGNVTTGP